MNRFDDIDFTMLASFCGGASWGGDWYQVWMYWQREAEARKSRR